MRRLGFFAVGVAAMLAVLSGAARAQAYDTLAGQPDPRDFMRRDDSHLTLLGEAVRFMGYDIGWLGTQPDGSPPAAAPTPFEVRDALATAKALGGTVVRVGPIGAVPGCASCAARQAHPDPKALAVLDLVLKTARDMGLKVIVPLAGAGGPCPAGSAEPACAYLRGHGLSDPAAFFLDAGVRADFLAGIGIIRDHVNTLNGVVYRQDPTILAWENCLGCAASADPAAVSAWAEQVGQTVRSGGSRHLYESGAFAGRIGPAAARPVPPRLFATPSVDIVGDEVATGSDPAVARARLGDSSALVAAAGKAYVLDSVSWTPSIWKTGEDAQGWFSAIAKERTVSGALAGRLVGHAENGGFLPAPPSAPGRGIAALYFPGITTADMDAAAMQGRGRALRRLAYAMADIVDLPAYLLPPRPEIIRAAHGHLVWRGSAGAAKYTVQRSIDPSAPGTWEAVCDACATDLGGGWQDPAPSASPPAWYRVLPININGHAALPSEAVQATR